MFLKSFYSVSGAVGQIFILGFIGFILVKKGVLKKEGMNVLSRLVVEITLPAMIFARLIQGFDFDLRPAWWFFPLISFAVSFTGLLAGWLVVKFSGQKGEWKREFLSLTTFQNSGFIPFALLSALLKPEDLSIMFIYLFLFLLGFNLVIWSLGVHFLSSYKNKKLELAGFFSPPVLATLITMVLVGIGVNKFIPVFIVKSLEMVGDSTLVLAMFVVGGSLGLIQVKKIEFKPIILIIIVKLLVLPFLGVLLIWRVSPPPLVSLLIIMELAMPSATSLSIIVHHYNRGEDLLISQGILFTHIFSLVSVPFFLSMVWVN